MSDLKALNKRLGVENFNLKQRIKELEQEAGLTNIKLSHKTTLLESCEKALEERDAKNGQLQAVVDRLENTAQNYYKVMDLLQRTKMDHGLCKPRSRRACSHCNAVDDLEILTNEYLGAPIVLSQQHATNEDSDNG